jgi:hypothetical protein
MTATQIQFRRGSAAQTATFTGAPGEVVVDTTNNRVVVQDGATAGGWPSARVIDLAPACGRLKYVSAAQITFAPYNGDIVKIAGALYAIPSAGVTAANTSVYVNGTASQNLAASTLYYVYLFNNSGTLTVNFSTTGHATDTTAGNVGTEIESGNNAYSLIGMVYTNASSQFGGAALVASWFNRQGKAFTGSVTNNTTTSTTKVAFGTSVLSILCWADEPLYTGILCLAFNSVSGDYGQFFIEDQNSNIYVQQTCYQSNTNTNPFYCLIPTAVAEGVYILSLYGLSQASANTFEMTNITLYATARS